MKTDQQQQLNIEQSAFGRLNCRVLQNEIQDICKKIQYATNQIGSLVPLQVQLHSVQNWWCISDGLLHLKCNRPWHYWIMTTKVITKMPHRVPKGDRGLIKWAGERVPYPSLTLGVDCKREGWSRYRRPTLVSILTTPHWPKHSTQKSCVKLKIKCVNLLSLFVWII